VQPCQVACRGSADGYICNQGDHALRGRQPQPRPRFDGTGHLELRPAAQPARAGYLPALSLRSGPVAASCLGR
ncbi:hypothetical protein QU38_00620, partial [Staphylococcus aureus]